MPGFYPPEFCEPAVTLVRAGKPISQTATELGISESGLHNWVCQDQTDRGERPKRTTPESKSTELGKPSKTDPPAGNGREDPQAYGETAGRGLAGPKRIHTGIGTTPISRGLRPSATNLMTQYS